MGRTRFLVYAILCVSAVAGHDTKFYVDNSVDDYENVYWVTETGAALLICEPHGDARELVISMRGMDGHWVELVKDKRLVHGFGEFELGTPGDEHRLSYITPKDGTDFKCEWFNPWLGCGFICPGNDEERQLHIRVRSPENRITCSLVNDPSILFVGDSMALICSYEDLVVTFSNGGNYRMSRGIAGEMLYSIQIHIDDSRINGSKIVCMKPGDILDYCTDIPPVVIYEDLRVMTSPSHIAIRDGANVTISCSSDFEDPTSFEWEIIGNISYNNAASERTLAGRGREYTISYIYFNLSDVGYFSVQCRITVGSKTEVATVPIVKLDSTTPPVPVSTTTTSPVPISTSATPVVTTSGSTKVSTALGNKGANEPLVMTEQFLIPLIGVIAAIILVIAIFAAVLIYRRRTHPAKTPGTSSRVDWQMSTTGNEVTPNPYVGDGPPPLPAARNGSHEVDEGDDPYAYVDFPDMKRRLAEQSAHNPAYTPDDTYDNSGTPRV